MVCFTPSTPYFALHNFGSGLHMIKPNMIKPKTILLTSVDDFGPRELESYAQADEALRKYALTKTGGVSRLRVVIVFTDLFVWTTSLAMIRGDSAGEHLVQRAIQADWEFNAGVRPAWWPETPEADRMWGVHYREDRDNGRAELARMRLERYDLQPVALSPLPARLAPPPPGLPLSIDSGGPP